jgi:hypothetical protein
MWSCNGGNSLSGEYVCTKSYIESNVGDLKLAFNDDGTCALKGASMNINGTYEIKDDSVYISTKHFELTFKVEENKVFNSSTEYVKE